MITVIDGGSDEFISYVYNFSEFKKLILQPRIYFPNFRYEVKKDELEKILPTILKQENTHLLFYENMSLYTIPIIIGEDEYKNYLQKKITLKELEVKYKQPITEKREFDKYNEQNRNLRKETKSETVWNACKTFSDAIKNMVLFLKGKIPSTPWHLDKVDDETIPLLSKLRKINQKGFLTFEGQPGKIESYEKPEVKHVIGYQKGYLSGFIQNSKLKSFMNKLLKTEKVLIYTYQYSTCGIKGFSSKEEKNRIMIERYFNEEYGIESRKIPLTVEVDTMLLSSRDYTNFRLYDSHAESEAELAPSNLEKILREQTTFVFVMTKEFGDSSLEDLVLKALD